MLNHGKSPLFMGKLTISMAIFIALAIQLVDPRISPRRWDAACRKPSRIWPCKSPTADGPCGTTMEPCEPANLGGSGDRRPSRLRKGAEKGGRKVAFSGRFGWFFDLKQKEWKAWNKEEPHEGKPSKIWGNRLKWSDNHQTLVWHGLNMFEHVFADMLCEISSKHGNEKYLKTLNSEC